MKMSSFHFNLEKARVAIIFFTLFFIGFFTATVILSYPYFHQLWFQRYYGVSSPQELSNILGAPVRNVNPIAQQGHFLITSTLFMLILPLTKFWKNSRIGKTTIILIATLAFLTALPSGIQVSQAESQTPTYTIEPEGLLPRDWNYLIYKSGATIYAIDGSDCSIAYSGSDFASVLNNVISAIKSTTLNRGIILIKPKSVTGSYSSTDYDYEVSSQIDLSGSLIPITIDLGRSRLKPSSSLASSSSSMFKMGKDSVIQNGEIDCRTVGWGNALSKGIFEFDGDLQWGLIPPRELVSIKNMVIRNDQWNGTVFYFKAKSEEGKDHYITFVTIENVMIEKFANAIYVDLYAPSGQIAYINANVFKNIVSLANVFLNVSSSGGDVRFNKNIFLHCQQHGNAGQSNARGVLIGSGVTAEGNRFDLMFWDITLGSGTPLYAELGSGCSNNIFYMADLDRIVDNGTNNRYISFKGEEIKEIFITPLYGASGDDVSPAPDRGSVGAHTGFVLANNEFQMVYFEFKVPDDFESLIEAHFVLIPINASGNIYRYANAHLAKNGENYKDLDPPSLAYATESVSNYTINELADCSSIFSGMSRGHYVGVVFARDAKSSSDTVDGDVLIIGLRIKYKALTGGS